MVISVKKLFLEGLVPLGGGSFRMKVLTHRWLYKGFWSLTDLIPEKMWEREGILLRVNLQILASSDPGLEWREERK